MNRAVISVTKGQGSAGGAAGEVAAQVIDSSSICNLQLGSVTDVGRVGEAAAIGAVAGGTAGVVGGAVHDGLAAAGHGRVSAAAYSGGASGTTGALGNPQTASQVANGIQASTLSGARAGLNNATENHREQDQENR